jgi:hypothetical protein
MAENPYTKRVSIDIQMDPRRMSSVAEDRRATFQQELDAVLLEGRNIFMEWAKRQWWWKHQDNV